MNILFKTTLCTLKKNKVRTAVTIIGIILSAAMMCAVIVSISSLFNYLEESYSYSDGNWHVVFYSGDKKDCEYFASNEEVERAVTIEKIGYATFQNDNEYKPYAYVAGINKDAADTLAIHITYGSFPSSENEILLPEHLASVGGVYLSVGDEITLDIGTRVLDGDVLWQGTPLYGIFLGESNEQIIDTSAKTFKVSGFYERPSFEASYAPGYTFITVQDNSPEKTFDIFCRLKNPKNVFEFGDKQHLKYNDNTNCLMGLGISKYSNFTDMVRILEAIIILIIAIGSISLIYTAFSISVSERMKQFGLLSSIGATKKQLLESVIFEALAVSALGIPIGVLSGVSGIGVTLMLIGKKLDSFTGFDVPIRLHISFSGLLVSCILALLTVLISALIPAVRASKVSAIEAIRMSRDIKAEKHSRGPVIGRLFGISGILASKYYRRSRKKYRTTVISLAISVILFISATSFANYLITSTDRAFGGDSYDIYYYVSGNIYDKEKILGLYEKLRGADKVDKAACTFSVFMNCNLLNSEVDQSYIDVNGEDTEYEINVALLFVNDDEYNAFIEENYPNIDGANGLICDKITRFDRMNNKYVTFNVFEDPASRFTLMNYKQYDGYYRDNIKDGYVEYVSLRDDSDTFKVPLEEAVQKMEISNAVRISEPPYFSNGYGEVKVIFPFGAAEGMASALEGYDYEYEFFFTSEEHAECYLSIKQILSDERMKTGSLYDYAEADEEERNLVTVVMVFAYGFIVLISLICIANVFNTISTNVALRRREMAMLKSIGMEKSAFNKMTCYECLLYGTRALLLGLPLSLIVSYFIYLGISEGFEASFAIPIMPMITASLSVFAVVFATMIYAMRKIKKDNPIDALKNENI